MHCPLVKHRPVLAQAVVQQWLQLGLAVFTASFIQCLYSIYCAYMWGTSTEAEEHSQGYPFSHNQDDQKQ